MFFREGPACRAGDFVTNNNGKPHQFFWYSPWGEPLVQQYLGAGDFSSRYLFNAKELDEESGNYYYGARYYNPQTSIWLSVDPMAQYRPSLTPYNFMSDNPVMRVDPFGMLDGWVEGKDGKFTFDPDVHSQQDLKDQGKSGTYKGEQGTGYDEQGNKVLYNNDGSSYHFPQLLADAEVTGKLTDHEQALRAGNQLGIYEGHRQFIEGTLDIIDEIASKTGTGVTWLGIVTLQPELVAAGEGISYVGTVSHVSKDLMKGDVSDAAETTAITIGTGGLMRGVDKSTKTVLTNHILKGSIEMQKEIYENVISPKIKTKLKL